jgi:acyl-CoA thioester hydrolase
MEQSGTMMPIAAMNSKYIRLASYDDLLTVKNFVKQMPKATMVFDYEIYNQHQTLIHQAQTTLVFIDVKTQRPVRCPEFLHQALEPFFSNS